MSLKVIEPNKAIQDAVYLEDFEFTCGRKVPMYQVNSIYALTQIIGYVKYINASYGNVLYRGQCKLYRTIETSVYKGYKQDKIEMRGDRAEMSDFPLYLNMVAGGLDRRDQTIGGFSFVVKIYALPVVEIIG